MRISWQTLCKLTSRGFTEEAEGYIRLAVEPECDNPVYRVLKYDEQTRRDMSRVYGVVSSHPTLEYHRRYLVHFKARCRKCEKCKAVQRRQWIKRSLLEWDALSSANDVGLRSSSSLKCWFVTLTISPSSALALAATSPSPESLKKLGKHLTLYLKRVRKKVLTRACVEKHRLNVPVFRYLATCEMGDKHGRLHWHLIVFSNCCGKKDLQQGWSHGITEVEWADNPNPGQKRREWWIDRVGYLPDAEKRRFLSICYTVAYLTAQPVKRVRASLCWGSKKRVSKKNQSQETEEERLIGEPEQAGVPGL